MDETILNFQVQLYGALQKYSDTISKCRCRIFYKYGNRNGTYITDEFAEELLSTVAYAPIKGIYDESSGDYTTHGISNAEGRIYGIVPENPNFAWEVFLDNDGVEREYACVDVLVYTALYTEASAIVGKPQSMELYRKTLKGHYEIIGGIKYYVFDSGSFLGLQVLGDNVEPCFEGAAFFSYDEYQELKKIVTLIEEANLFSLQDGGEKSTMEHLNFKLSDSQKLNALFAILNENYNEENDWAVTYSICEVYDEYALAYNYETGNYERIYYTKDDESDSVTVNAKKKCYVLDVTEEEKRVLDLIKERSQNSFELADQIYTQFDELSQEKENLLQEKIECDNSIATLTTENQTLISRVEEFEAQIVQHTADFNELSDKFAQITAENEELSSFKHVVETAQKNAVIAEYTSKLSQEILDEYSSRIDEFTVDNLDKELAYEFKKNNFSAFSNSQPQTAVFIPKIDEPASGIESILIQYTKKED